MASRRGGGARDLTTFVGRRRELDAVRGLLDTSRLVTVFGVGGAGKTRIATRLLAEVHEDGAAGWFVPLADITDPGHLGSLLAQSIGLQVRGSDALLETVAARLRRDPDPLLVLDNCEHLHGEAAQAAGDLLRLTPGLRILATSRQALGLGGEAVYELPALSLPATPAGAARDVDPAAVESSEAAQLFVDRARTLRPDFTITPANAAAVAGLCRALGGVPLAIELAAARITVLTPAAILDRLTDQHHLLSRGYANAPERHRSLRASVDWSYELCTDQERALWARLSVFTGGFETDAAEQVCGTDGVSRSDILDLLGSLASKAIIAGAPEQADRRRLLMLESIRQYGADLLHQAAAEETFRHRHLQWCAALAARSRREWVSVHQAAHADRLRAEIANLRAALSFAADSGDPAVVDLGRRLVADLEQFWLLAGLMTEGVGWATTLSGRAGGDPDARAAAFRVGAHLAALLGRVADAEALLEQALAQEPRSEETDRLLVLTDALLSGIRDGSLPSLPRYQRAIEGVQRAGDVVAEAHGRLLQGTNLALTGKIAESQESLGRCIALTEPHQERHIRSMAHWSMGLNSIALGEPGVALVRLREALQMGREIGDSFGIALQYEVIAWALSACGNPADAARLHGFLAGMWSDLGLTISVIGELALVRQVSEPAVLDALGSEKVDALRAEGALLSADDAFALALGRGHPPSPRAALAPLTPREAEVALLVAEGLSDKEIAARLVLSVRTAQGHVERSLRKLGFRSRTQLATWVVNQRLGEP